MNVIDGGTITLPTIVVIGDQSSGLNDPSIVYKMTHVPLTLVVKKNSFPDLTIVDLPGIPVHDQSNNNSKKLISVVKMSSKSFSKITISREFDDFPYDTQMHYFKRLLEIFRAFSQELKNNLVTKGCENFELQEIQLLEEGKGFGSTPSTLLEHVSSSLLPRKIGTSTPALVESHLRVIVHRFVETEMEELNRIELLEKLKDVVEEALGEGYMRKYISRFETLRKSTVASPRSLDAMNAEIQSMIDNMVWVLVDLFPNCKTVGKMFSPVADIRAIRILISIAVFYDYEIWQMNVKTAFLNGYLDEDIYMVKPEGFVDPNHPRKVCKLQKSIYDLKQASRS
ncbi:retrotransposon protein, putative, ty1-copia subclass [Tanacetum coccineum]